jgi:hypothetical protein
MKKKGSKTQDVTLDDLTDNAQSDASSLSDLAIDWENILDESGKQLKFSKDVFYNAAFRALDLRVQSLKFISDSQVFFNA